MSRRVAVVGSGPSGFYAAAALLKSDPDCRVDVLDRLPTPFGLVRGGVAPDHQKIKSVVRAYNKTAANERFRFFGNVELGTHLTLEELQQHYDQVVLAVGAPKGRHLGIPGEDLPGIHTATDFVAWYNGHPDLQQRAFDLDVDDAVIVGVGNVSMDVCRVLASPKGRLDTSDITDQALTALGAHTRRRIHVLGRRGPAQAAFTPKEIQEIRAIDGIDVRSKKEEAELDPLSAAWLESDGARNNRDNAEFVSSCTGMRLRSDPTEVWLRFLVSPVAFLGTDRLEAVRVEKNEIVENDGWLGCRGTGVFEEIPCGAAFLAVGYRSVPLPGVPFDESRGRIPNDEGRVLDGDTPIDDLFVVGWAKRGPTGLIGTNRADSVAVVKTILATPVVNASSGDPAEWLGSRSPRLVTWDDWQILDELEVAAGVERGRPRVKFTNVDEMLSKLS